MSSRSLQKTNKAGRSAREHDQTFSYFLERAAFGAQPQIAEILTEETSLLAVPSHSAQTTNVKSVVLAPITLAEQEIVFR